MTSLPAASRIPSDVGIRWLQASYFVIGFAMPVLFLVCMLGLWVVPLSLHRAKMALMVAEVINAWSALDVFVIALVACLLEIQQFAAFIVGMTTVDFHIYFYFYVFTVINPIR